MQRKDKTPFPQIGEVEKSVGGLNPLVLFINDYNQRDFNP